MDTPEFNKYDYRALTIGDVYRTTSTVKDLCESDIFTYKYEPPSVMLSDEPSKLWDDYVRRTGASTITIPGMGEYRPHPWEHFVDYEDDFGKGEKPTMSYEQYITEGDYHDKHVIVRCNDTKDLSPENILHSLAVIKSELMMKCLPYQVNRITCEMTPEVKHNITAAYQRLARYGKEEPFIYCCDEYFRPIGEECKIATLKGMIIQIVDPKFYGTHYLKFEGIIRDIDQK